MVVTIEDRSVTRIPEELESPLILEPCCITCKTTNVPLQTCLKCKLVSYCCRRCYLVDWRRHKTEECRPIRQFRLALNRVTLSMEANRSDLIQQAVAMYGENAFFGRNFQMEDGSLSSVVELLAGRFGGGGGMAQTSGYVNCILMEYRKVAEAAERHNTRTLWEAALELAVQLKRLTHVAIPNMMDETIVRILLKLHRDDDVVSFLLYWILWRSEGEDHLGDPLMLHSAKGEWPYPCETDFRLVSIAEEIRNCKSQEGDIWFPVSFCMAVLAVKLRHIAVHRNLLTHADEFLNTEVEMLLPGDILGIVVPFVTGGERAAWIYASQVHQAKRLMVYMFKEYPAILQAVLEPRRLPTQQKDEEGMVTDFDAREFLEKYGGGALIVDTLTDIMKELYA